MNIQRFGIPLDRTHPVDAECVSGDSSRVAIRYLPPVVQTGSIVIAWECHGELNPQ
jgi:hypothetical protein